MAVWGPKFSGICFRVDTISGTRCCYLDFLSVSVFSCLRLPVLSSQLDFEFPDLPFSDVPKAVYLVLHEVAHFSDKANQDLRNGLRLGDSGTPAESGNDGSPCRDGELEDGVSQVKARGHPERTLSSCIEVQASSAARFSPSS